MKIQRAATGGWVALFCLGLLLPARAAEVDAYLPNDTEVVAQVNIRQLLDAPLIKQHALELMKAALKSNGDVDKVFQQLGLDPFADLNTFTLAGSGAEDPNKGVIIVHGKFDASKFRARADSAVKEGAPLQITQSGPYTVYEVKVPQGPTKSMYVAMPDGRTIVASPKKEMLADALDKHAGKKQGAINADLKARVEKHGPGETAWIVALSKSLGKGPVASDPNAKELLDKSITLSSSVTIGKDVDLGATIDATTAQDAVMLQKKLSDLIEQGKGILEAFATSNKELAPLLDLAKSLKVTANDKTVTLSGTIPQAVIERAMQRK